MRFELRANGGVLGIFNSLEDAQRSGRPNGEKGEEVLITSLTGVIPSVHWYFDTDKSTWIEGLPDCA